MLIGKKIIEEKVNMYRSLSEMCEDEALDRDKEKTRFVQCILRPNNGKASGSDGSV